MNKTDAFDYLLYLYKQWFDDVAPKGESFENISKLAVLKMLFLTSAPKNNTDNDDLLSVFNNFYALPYGPVESDIYNAIKSDLLPNFTITERSVLQKNSDVVFSLSAEDKERLENVVDNLRQKNQQLIQLNPFDLVEITHQWDSWKNAYHLARFMGKQRHAMSEVSIKMDRNKYFGD